MVAWGCHCRSVAANVFDCFVLSNREPGITVGAVVVPQGMAYAKLANLPVQFGLYSSFMGDLLYWAFGTSKDITIGVGTHLTCFPTTIVKGG
jgi:MFS superfamily sulfate permease-like transporter